MGELYDPFPKLPKNIRQIGEKEQIAKLYVEDYVNTYLKRLYPTDGQDLRAGLLLGTVEINDGTPYIFVDGAMEMEGITQEGRKVQFTDVAWKKARQDMEQMFPKRSIQGWFLCGLPGSELSPINYWKQHVQYFQGPHQLMYLSGGMEGEESVYITSEDGFSRLKGYCIYYERNQMMQDYMVLRKEGKRSEAEANDKVIQEFRKRMDDHKEEAHDRRQNAGLLKGACMAMSVVILAGGIVFFNNYEKMNQMEGVIASAIPQQAGELIGVENQKEGEGRTQSGQIIIEEAAAGIDISREQTQAAVSASQEADSAPLVTSAKDHQTDEAASAGQAESESAAETGQPSEIKETKDSGQNQMQKEQTVSEQTDENRQEEESILTGNKENMEEGRTMEEASLSAKTYIVQPGETLYDICLKEYGNVNQLEKICSLNGLENQDRIMAGQKLLLP